MFGAGIRLAIHVTDPVFSAASLQLESPIMLTFKNSPMMNKNSYQKLSVNYLYLVHFIAKCELKCSTGNEPFF